MRIIQFIPSIEYAGAETMCCNLTKALVELGHDVEVISMYNSSNSLVDELSQSVKIHFLGKKKGADFSIIPKARKIIKEFKPDIVHTHIGAIKYAIPACKGLPVKNVHTIHSVAQNETSKFWQIINKRYYLKKRVTPVALSIEVKKTLIDVYGIKSEQVPVVYNGIPIEKCIRKESYDIQGKIKLINVARFFPVKNQKFLIDCIKTLKEKYSNVEITFVGDGPLLKDCKEYAQQQEVMENVVFYGICDNIYELLPNADIFVLSSVYEGMPMTIIEAMATGLPVLATSVGGIPSMISDNDTGLLVDLQEQEFIEKIELLINDRDLRKNLGENAAKIAGEKFSSKAMAQQYVKVYSEIIGK